MVPFYTRFSELAPKETRCIHVLASGQSLPKGEYAFVECYCEDVSCDCRRTVIQVLTPEAPDTPLATINFGWESVEFYAKRLHGDFQAGRDIVSATLDPLNPQSSYSDVLLGIFRDLVVSDAGYVARLARHYRMFKDSLLQPEADTDSESATLDRGGVARPMTKAEILDRLELVPDDTDFAPYELALQACEALREELTPELIGAIERVTANPGHYLENPGKCLHLFAIYLLAQWRERRALDAILRFVSLPGDQALDLTGDLVTEDGRAILASVSGGDPAPLLALIHNESINEFVCSAAMSALVVQAAWEERSRADVVEELRRLFHGLPRPGNSSTWGALVSAVCDLGATELAAEARSAFVLGLVDEDYISSDNLEQSVSAAPGIAFKYFKEHHVPIDAINLCSSWICFRENNSEVLVDDEAEEEVEEWGEEPVVEQEAGAPSWPSISVSPSPEPYIAAPKVGRNDPCPCGSGKKFKKCCGS